MPTMDRAGGDSTRASLLARTAPVRFAAFTLDLDGCSLSKADGSDVPLTHNEFVALREFVRHPGRVLSRDYLLDALVGKRAGPFDRGVDVLIGKLRRRIEADPKRPRLIVTVPGEGYRFDGLKQTLSPKPSIAVLASPNDDRLAGRGATAAAPPRLSLVVLPFANMGGDPEQEYFVDGVTESLTTDLSRISGAFVIGRSTAFTYRGKAFDHRQIGRELNVRYVLEGSVQRSGARMRVNVQLIEAETGAHLWAERFDKPVADLFDMQDEIVARLANQLQAELIAAEARRAEQAPNPDSMDLYFQGRATLNRGLSPDLLERARGFFGQALELGEDNVDALVGLARTDLWDAWSFKTDDPLPLMAAVEMKLSQALAAAPNHAHAHILMGYLLCGTNRAARGIEEFERAVAIDPNFAHARGGMGLAHVLIGRAEETEAHVLEALRLSPRDAHAYGWFTHVGFAKACLGEYEAAVAWFRKSIDANRNNPWAFFELAACLAHLGRLSEARQAVQAGLAMNPKFTIRRFLTARESDNPVYVAQHKRVVEGMRLAGVPEE
jgi:TolB-like protein